MVRARQLAVASILRIFLHEDVNFLVTNRLPRRTATLLAGRLSRIRSRRLTRTFLRVWSLFDDLHLEESREQDFESVRDCFVRQLRAGARPVDPDPRVVTSPCDAVIGEFGDVRDGHAIQAKGFPYRLIDLLGDDQLVERYRMGKFITLRLRASMYHRFHAPCDGRIRRVRYISGDTWNVNPIALQRVERLFCRNERAVLPLDVSVPGSSLTLVAVAAILVASIRLNFIATPLDLRWRSASDIDCDFEFVKGQELGYFENGSTIIVFATSDFEFAPHIASGSTLRTGEVLFQHVQPISHSQENAECRVPHHNTHA